MTMTTGALKKKKLYCDMHGIKVTFESVEHFLELMYGGDKRYTFNYQRSNSLEEVLNIVEYLTGEHCEVIYRKK